MTTLLQSHEDRSQAREETLRRVRQHLRDQGQEALIPLAEELSESQLALDLMRMGGPDYSLTDRLFSDLPGEPGREEVHWSELDRKLLSCPLAVATRERYALVREALCAHWKVGQTIADLPCGRMRALLTAPGRPDQTTLVGIDKDPEAIKAAISFAKELDVPRVCFYQRDALRLLDVPLFDLVLSNGLTIYLDESSVKEFYAQVRQIVNPGGVFIVANLTPPEEWDMDQIDLDLLRFERTLLGQVVKARWLPHLRCGGTCRSHLEGAGFKVEDVLHDQARRSPTYVCRAR